MKLLLCIFIYAVLSASFGQDSQILPEWETRETGYELRVLAEGEGTDTGPYGRINVERYQEKAAEMGAYCYFFEKLVWNKPNATLGDLSSFRKPLYFNSALLRQFIVPVTHSSGFNSYTFETTNPIILGSWIWVYSPVGDSSNSLYIIYEACAAM